MAVDDIWAVHFRGVARGVAILNTMHFRQLSEPSGDDHDALEASIATEIRSPYRGCFTEDYTLDELGVEQVITGETYKPNAERTYSMGMAGTRDDLGWDLAPVWLTGEIRIPGTLRGRRRRGRIFVGTLTDGDIQPDGSLNGDAGYLLEALRTLTTAMAHYVPASGDFADDVWELGVFSWTGASKPGVGDAVGNNTDDWWTPGAAPVASTLMHTQKSRLS